MGTNLITLIPILNVILSIFYLVDKGETNTPESFIDYLALENKAFKCRNCNITHRKWQRILNHKKIECCPHCETETYYNTKEVSSDLKYPFARKLKKAEYVKLIKEKQSKNNKLNKYNHLMEMDKELKAYVELLEKQKNKIEKGAVNE
jgi:hypothetical protein